jgi:hypothetical protein
MNARPLQLSATFTVGMVTMAILASCSAEANKKVVTAATGLGDAACALAPLLSENDPNVRLVCDIEHAVSPVVPKVVEVVMRTKPQSADGGARSSAAPSVVYACSPVQTNTTK